MAQVLGSLLVVQHPSVGHICQHFKTIKINADIINVAQCIKDEAKELLVDFYVTVKHDLTK